MSADEEKISGSLLTFGYDSVPLRNLRIPSRGP